MLTRRLRYWLESGKREAALRAEMELHMEEKAAELQAAGYSEAKARSEARRRFGNFGVKQEQSREIWIARYWSDFWQDARYGARSLATQPGFTAAAVMALVLGIAVNAVLFNVYNALALAPWAVRDAGRTVQVLALRNTSREARWNGFSWPHFRYLAAQAQSLEGLAAFGTAMTRVRRGEVSWSAAVVPASENYFEVLGTGFAAGRGFSTEKRSLKDPAPEVVLHYDTWMSRFGGDPAILGQWLELSGHRLQVVGVAAPGFSGPMPTKPHLWIPGGWRDIFEPGFNTFENAGSCCISVIGRLKPGVTRAGAQAELETLSSQFLSSIQEKPTRILATAPSFLANPTNFNKVSPVFLVMGVAAVLILLLACANVANLQLARAVARRREIAVRLSLGASRGRLLRQLLAESLLVSVIAGTGSVAVSAWAPDWIVRRVLSPDEALAIHFSNDVRVLGFILAATVAAAILFGMMPALGAIRGAAPGLREGGRGASAGRMRGFLLASQVALCAILVSGTALLVRALDHVRHLDTGFNYEKVLLVATGLDTSGVDEEQAGGLLGSLIERAGGLPGVRSVAHAAVLPFGNSFMGSSLPDPRGKGRLTIGFNQVSANFLETLRVPLVAGRALTRADEAKGDAAIVNEAAAERLWPGENPLGKQLQLWRTFEVVGVARNFNTRHFGSERDPSAWIASRGTRVSKLVIRHDGDPGALAAEMPKAAREIDNRFAASAAPYGDAIAAALSSARVSATVAGVLGGLALLLACVGIYGVAAYNVSQRTREVGVRIALGARPRAILTMVLRQNLRTVAIGACVGIAGAIGFGQLLTSLLFGLEPTDPPALLATIGILLATSGLAAWGPARRASRVDPAITLRHE